MAAKYEFFLGQQPMVRSKQDPDYETGQARAAGLKIKDLRMERCGWSSSTSAPSSTSCAK